MSVDRKIWNEGCEEVGGICTTQMVDKIIDTLKIVEAQNKTQGECIKTLSKMVKLQTEEITNLTKRVEAIETGHDPHRRQR